MKVSARVRVSGPLTECIAGFAAALAERGYTDLSLANQLRLAAHFSRWLEQEHLEVSQLTLTLLDRTFGVAHGPGFDLVVPSCRCWSTSG
jgi:hypothetical protein